MPNDLSLLMTEQQNMNTLHIDEMDTIEILNTINQEDKNVALAVRNELVAISKAVDAIYKKVARGGRLIYIGAGTSGRLGVLDASECPPTYGVSPTLVQGIIAGGTDALLNAIEGAEDSQELAKEDLEKIELTEHDVVCGLAASGRTAYVIGGIKYANLIGATTLSICCVSKGLISNFAQYPIEVKVGPEVITGSTRMKAGTAQKMVLNMLSTSVMIKLGKVYGNLMIDVQPTNEKLKKRAIGIVEKCTGLASIEAKKLLESTGYDVKCAILMEKTKLDFESCRNLLLKYQNNVTKVIRQYKK